MIQLRGRGNEFDFVIVGGGFYGVCLALYLRSISDSVLLVEAENELFTRASRVNQARVHTGFHYPRSFVTSARSLALHQRFASDFPEAIVDDFRMLYAVARWRSKVSASRFHRMYKDMGAPITVARQEQRALFSSALIENVFECREYAFDYTILRERLRERLDRHGVSLSLGARVDAFRETGGKVELDLGNGASVRAGFAFNVTYSGINRLLAGAQVPAAPLKHEFTEVALVTPPPSLEGFGVTVMDGPFFSIMPYPSAGLYSLTHVRYTPHASWTDSDPSAPGPMLQDFPQESRVRHTIQDAKRYMPCIEEATWVRSLYEVKTVLVHNEGDDGRPILFQRQPEASRIISIMGGKLDNIYDLFELMRTTEPAWAQADGAFIRDVAP